MSPILPLRCVFAGLSLAVAASPAAAADGRLAFFANGEALAVEGFSDPALTADGWALSFERVVATIADAAAWRTDPPFAGDGPAIAGEAVALPGVFTVDLTETGPDGRVALGAVAAPPGHYNALSWSLAPAAEGEYAGYSLVFVGTATRGDQMVAFTLATRDRQDHACGEYVGDERKGFLDPDGEAELELTLHLDHLFGRADLGPADPMNVSAPGFDRFAGGGLQEFALAGLHIGHVGEGHCHATAR